MMWSLIFLLGSLSMVLGNSEQCKEAIMETYKIHKGTVDFPKTTEDLQEICKYFFDLNKQLVRAYEACKEDLPPELWIHQDYYPTVFRNITEFCNSESNVNKAIVKDLGCLLNVYEGKSETCAQLTSSALEKGGVTNQYDQLTKCMKRLFKLGCLAKNMGDTCGSAAESAIFEGTALLKSMNEFCTSYMMMQATEKLPEIDLDAAIKERVGTFIGALAWDETFPISFN